MRQIAHRLAIALAAFTMAGLALPARATGVTGPYINLGLGSAALQQASLASATLPGPGNVNLGSSAGAIGLAGVGWGFGQGLRLEINGTYQRNDVTGAGGLSTGGKLEQIGGFANAIWDFSNFGARISPGLSPYAGVGAGYNYARFADTGGGDGGFAAQAMVGLSYDVTAVPGLAVTAEYRFSATPENLSFQGQFFPQAEHSYFHTGPLYDQAGLIGLRYAFSSAAPPPTVAVPPAPLQAAPQIAHATSYLVFFDWDRADLSARGREIVATAAEASRHTATTHIEVDGYTDLSGSIDYNQKLSRRRANTVRDELVRDGVDKDEITIFGKGETNPLVPTAIGVRAPQNRRVEIILR
jgi:outer membrane protein OmpA-like peptidoglycan-associated protein